MSPEILCTLPLPEPFPRLLDGAARVRVIGSIPTPGELAEELRARPADVICPQLSDDIDAQLLEAAGPRLRAIALYAVGYNNVDIEAATRRGVAVANTPGVLTDATADLAMALMLATARRLCEGDAAVRRGDFPAWTPDTMLGADLSGMQLGVIGFGRIGQAVARRALGFSMQVVYARRDSVALAEDLRGRVSDAPLDEVIAHSDVVTLHVPLTSETHHLVSEDVLRRMKPTALLINTARGPVVEEAALVRALREGWIAGAGLDVYESEPELAPGLAGCVNAVLAPHIGSATPRTRADMAELCALNAVDALAGRVPRSCVNPHAWASGSPVPLLPPGR